MYTDDTSTGAGGGPGRSGGRGRGLGQDLADGPGAGGGVALRVGGDPLGLEAQEQAEVAIGNARISPPSWNVPLSPAWLPTLP